MDVQGPMNKRFRLIMAALAILPVAQASRGAGPAPDGGTVAIEPKTVSGDYDPALQSFADAAASALAGKGFTVLPDTGHAAWVVELLLSRDDVGTGKARVAGQRAASMVGAGVSVPLSTGRSELVALQRTRLEMRFRRRGETGVVWDGAAVTVREAGTPRGTATAVAADLSQAVLGPYPIAPTAVLGIP